MDPLPSVNRVFSMVIQNERQHAIVASPLDETNDFANAIASRIAPMANTLSSKFHGYGGGEGAGKGNGGQV